MIRHLRGTIYARTDKSVILDVHGTGYEIFVPQGILMTLAEGQDAALWTHLAVRETSMELFGFQDMQYLVFFEMLLGVSGIGPRSALGIIDIASLETLQKAIAHDDISYLTKVSGIGKRTAEKIIVELRDKMTTFKDDRYGAAMHQDNEVVEALQALGYSLQQSRDALKDIPQDITSTQERIKRALGAMRP